MFEIDEKVYALHKEEIDKIQAVITANKAKKAPFFYARQNYSWYREWLDIDEKMVLLEALDGAHPTGNVAALVKELNDNPEYAEYKIYLSGRRNVYETRMKYVETMKLDRVTVLISETEEYYRILATAKFLVTETSFNQMFIKRPEQVFLNTWHGTPLKTLGKKIKNDHAMLGNLQKNFFEADYLLYPNEFTMKCMLDDYMLNNFCKAEVLLSGYPRNQVFHDEKRREEVRTSCGFSDDMQYIAFMPTWRGAMSNVNGLGQNELLCSYFDVLDRMLTEKQVMFVKLHYMNAEGIDLSKYIHIKPFPQEYDGYEFLNALDVLVTDYSSVFFDYAITRKKVILFTYDLEEYTRDRGFYLSLDELPFPRVSTLEELVEELARPKDYDDTELLQRFCPYEKPGVTNALLQKFLFGKDSELVECRPVPDNGKKNVLLYIGGFAKNELTAAAIKLLNAVDKTKYNYAVVFPMEDIRSRQDDINVLPEGVDYHGFYQWKTASPAEYAEYAHWKAEGKASYDSVKDIVLRMCRRDGLRMFGPCRLDAVIQYSGYFDDVTAAFEQMPCKRSIYICRDMAEICSDKKNMDEAFFGDMYNKYDAVAIASNDVWYPSKKLADKYRVLENKAANFVLCREVIDDKSIIENASRMISFEGAVINMCKERLFDALESKNIKKFAAYGNFTKDKGFERLIDAFNSIHEEDTETFLLICGDTGILYDKLAEKVKELSCSGSVCLVQKMQNPYPLIAMCDYYVSSSLYEGLGTNLANGDVLGLSCIATDVPGNHDFMMKFGGCLVEDSTEGLEAGMRACLQGNVPKRLSIDYEEYNREAVAQFESLLP